MVCLSMETKEAHFFQKCTSLLRSLRGQRKFTWPLEEGSSGWPTTGQPTGYKTAPYTTFLKIKQLDVGMSPPGFSFTLMLTLTFDPCPLTLHLSRPGKMHNAGWWCTTQVGGAQRRSVVQNIVLYPCGGAQLDPDGQKAMSKRPPCMSTGGLKNEPLWLQHCHSRPKTEPCKDVQEIIKLLLLSHSSWK